MFPLGFPASANALLERRTKDHAGCARSVLFLRWRRPVARCLQTVNLACRLIAWMPVSRIGASRSLPAAEESGWWALSSNFRTKGASCASAARRMNRQRSSSCRSFASNEMLIRTRAASSLMSRRRRAAAGGARGGAEPPRAARQSIFDAAAHPRRRLRGRLFHRLDGAGGGSECLTRRRH
jgi:hypothetical protein